MLKSRKIHFQHHDLLTVQMLETMQLNSLEAAIAPYLLYADGIISGLSVSMDEVHQLKIGPGTVKWRGQLYIMTEDQVACILPEDCAKGWVILLPNEQSFEVALVEHLPETEHIVLTAFSNRDVGSKLKPVSALKQLRFMNYMNASAVRIAGADGQLTYNEAIAQCFAKELLAALGADTSDMAFAWQAMQTPPTKTMWELYLQRNEAVWTMDGEQFVKRLLEILKWKEQPLPMLQVSTVAEKAVQPQETFRQISID